MKLDLQEKERKMKSRAIKRLVGAICLFIIVVFVLPFFLGQPTLNDQEIAINDTSTARVFADQVVDEETKPVEPVNLNLVEHTEPAPVEPPKVQADPIEKEVIQEASVTTQPKEIEKPAPKAQDPIGQLLESPKAKPQVQYVLQLAAYSRKKDAEDKKRNLLQKGISKAYVERINTRSGNVLYRLRVGPFTQESEAQRMRDTLKKAYPDLIIRKN